ncbi:MAG: carboxypeptidase-like regulatory domain-containing protein [Proteobacteria bacterium]|nr:carboxypeptidase-like regulatory domain-containing protein [Pseudomonadota bacterium]
MFDAAGEVAGGGTVSSPGPNGTGAYVLRRSIAPGNYTLRTGSMFSGSFNEPYIEELYPNIACPGETCDFSSAGPGTPITVTLSTTTAPIDLALSIGNSISGTITELGGGAVIADVHVLIYDDSVPPRFAAWDTTDAAGNFTVRGLPNGNYYALTNNGSNLPFMGRSPTDPAGWIDILHDGIACPGGSCDFTTGDVIVVPTPRGVGISINLSQGATIAGKITDFNLQSGIADIVVNVFDDQGGFIASYQTNTLGDYITSGLPAGTYYLTTSSNEVLVDTIYGGGNCFIDNCDPLTGTPIVVANQQVVSGFDMVLRSNLLFKGTFE